MPHGQVSRRELTNLRTYKGTVSRLVERVSKIRQVLATTHTSGTGPSLSNGSSVLCCISSCDQQLLARLTTASVSWWRSYDALLHRRLSPFWTTQARWPICILQTRRLRWMQKLSRYSAGMQPPSRCQHVHV